MTTPCGIAKDALSAEVDSSDVDEQEVSADRTAHATKDLLIDLNRLTNPVR